MSKAHLLRALLLVGLWLAGLAGGAGAQQFTGTLRGTVQDSAGAVVAATDGNDSRSASRVRLRLIRRGSLARRSSVADSPEWE